ncbi:hypothetical protein HK096_000679, partial [Nowakowskiella sp. JEL0078]
MGWSFEFLTSPRDYICGLVALNIASQYFQNNSVTPKERIFTVGYLLEQAQKKGFSTRGEFFSVHNLASLARANYPEQSWDVCNWNETEGVDVVIQHIKNHGLVLVPYDRDKNNEPCIRNGHAAHWAVITGFAKPTSGLTTFINCDELDNVAKPSEVISDHYFLCYHGKSLHPAVWQAKLLLESNRNLRSVAPSVQSSPYNY